ESARTEKNEFTNRYIWTNSWCAPSGGMNMVNGFCQRDGSFVTNFFYAQPALNYGFAKPDPAHPWQMPMNHPDCLATRQALKDIIRFWLDMGADGYRVDMAPSLIRNDPEKKAIKKLWHDVIGMIKRDYPDAIMISEWFNNVQAVDSGFDVDFAGIFSFSAHQKLFRAEKKANVHFMAKTKDFGNEGHSFFRKAGKGDASEYIRQMTDTLSKIRRKGFVGFYTSNHDITRINVDRTQEELELVFAFVLTMPGVPFIYYGDEIGMRYMGELPSKEGGYTRTGSRTPMQWSEGKNAGFSSAAEGRLYLPVDKTKGRPTVAAQEKNPDSLLNGVRRLTTLRHELPALNADSDFTPLYVKKNAYPLVFLRSKGNAKAVVAINPSGRKVKAAFTAAQIKTVRRMLLGKNVKLEKSGSRFSLEMSPVSYAIFDCE
ncbi:MAG TPA: alpha-amylase family glycosyl hydrolase, partial [Phycisphaerae bacterium]|nr:alpha-amylase family glycosyl hydrolase [Phycisphaerae bacterium]